MPDIAALLHGSRGLRIAAVLAGVTLLIGSLAVWSSARKRARLHEEVRWLRAQLASKRERLARQQQEMAEVASAVERLSRTAGALQERAVQARRLAHMEESREPVGVVPVTATLDGSAGLVSEDAARALEQLGWLDGQAAAVGDSIAVLSALLKEHHAASAKGVPSLWPVRGLVTSSFGARSSPYGGGREMHPGIDIKAQYGVPVTAGGDGAVVFAGRDPGYGALVVVGHAGDIDTFYGHLSSIYVREGQPVRRGQPIGAVGFSGRATGAHLHYEVRVHGSPVDPNRYLVN